MLPEKIRKLGFNITDRQFQIIQLIFTIGLMITIIVVGVAMFKYVNILKADPCSLCNPTLTDLSEVLK